MGSLQNYPRLVSAFECIRAFVLLVPVILVCGLLTWSFYVYNTYYLMQFFADAPFSRISISVLYHAVFALAMSSYYMTWRAQTVPVPASIFALSDAEVSALKEGVRFCRTCAIIKPDRAHHCSVCRTCIMKMDHHCPWVGNCVGWHNYKFFVLFLAWTFVYLCIVVASFFPFMASVFMGKPSAASPAKVEGFGSIMMAFLLASATSISVFILLVFHLYLVSTNRTTLEGFRRGHFVRPTKAGYKRPTVRQNLEQVFGKNTSKWLLPVGPGSTGNGYHFPVEFTDEYI